MSATRAWRLSLAIVVIVFLHNTLPHLTTMPRVNVDEPWLMERGYQVMRTGIPSQPMLGLNHAYLLQVGYGYLLAIWMSVAGVGIFQARLLGVLLGLGIVLMVAWIGRRTAGQIAGASAAMFLALDSNFLGSVRNARTDIPSVFFVAAAFAAYIRARRLASPLWFACSGASLGLAMLCHGNAFWAGVILLAWFVLDYRSRVLTVPYGYAVVGGWLATCGPYLAVVILRWSEVEVQIANFAADRVPGWRPSFIWQQMLREVERYRGWYFGLVTAVVPNPVLWIFRAAIVAGLVALCVRIARPRHRDDDAVEDPYGTVRLLVLAAGCAFIFAAFINNKVLVYLPHIMLGYALAAGFAVGEALALFRRAHRPLLAVLFVIAYGGAGAAYYEKWYSSALKSELVSYEDTEQTLRALVTAGPKYVFASPQFWTPFHADPGTTFFSYAAAHPTDTESGVALPGAADDRPIVLVVDELQWLQEMIGATSSTSEWQRGWIRFIERNCIVDGVAYGTAHGTLAAYRCSLANAPAGPPSPRLIGGATEFRVDGDALNDDADALSRWTRYDDPRRRSSTPTDVSLTADQLHIRGGGWPGIVKMFRANPGDAYLVTAETDRTRDGDLLYLGTWEAPQVRSLSGASSAGIAGPLLAPRWFPRARAFRAMAPDVRVLVYSEAATTDFVISSLRIQRLEPTTAGRR